MNHRSFRCFVIVLTALISISCSSGGGGTPATVPPAKAIIKGTLLDAAGAPVPAASVQCPGASAGSLTADDGTFALEVNVGGHKVIFQKNGAVVAEQCLAVAELVTYDLGTVTPSTPTNCDVVCTNDPAGPDPDCDGLSTALEQAGWDVTVLLGDGTTETRHVWSDPNKKDTDGDGLTDAEEYAARTDPGTSDTDGDLLSDYAELTVYKSNPLMVDTDGDSRGPNGDKESDPNLWDGFELLLSHTSPVLADTDGDGMTDYEEIHSGGTNPLVANLPTLALEVYGDPSISLRTGVSTTCTNTSTTLVRESQEHVNTDNVSTKMSIENTVNLHTEAEAGTSTWPPSFSAKLTTDTEFKHGYIHETTANFTQSSMQQVQRDAACWEQTSVDFSNGTIKVAMKLVNQSGLSFMVKDLNVNAYQLTTGSNFRIIGTLVTDSTWTSTVLGPYGAVTLSLQKTDVDAETMKALVENPSALMFEVGSYSLFQLDEWGVNETVNYARLGESVIQQTGLLTIDYGNGTIERHMIATNVNRNPDGSARGITLKEALVSVLTTTFGTEEQKDSDGTVIGRKVLKRVKNVETYQNDPARPGRGFWIVGGTSDAFAEGLDADFEDIVLKSGQRISLVFLKDTDEDGLFDNEEALLGSNKEAADTDGDGLSDYEEAKVGWDVTVNGLSYHVYSDPRFADADGDYLSDMAEKAVGTDPFKTDTDADGVADTNDPYPLSAPCINGTSLGLAGWWNGTLATAGSTTVRDIWTKAGTGDPRGFASDGVLSGSILQLSWSPDYLPLTGLNNVFSFNLDPGVLTQSIVIEDNSALDTGRSLSPQAAFTLSAWVYWNGNATDRPWATIMTKGAPDTATYALLVGADGTLKLRLYRYAHFKCYGWCFGWYDSCCADSNGNRLEELQGPKLPAAAWAHVTATFSAANELMRIYLDYNGTLSSVEASTKIYTNSRDYWYTNNLVVNSDPLRVGLDSAPASAQWPFRGMMDEVQMFGRQMTPNEVRMFDEIGICAP